MRILTALAFLLVLSACASDSERDIQRNVYLLNEHLPTLQVYFNNIVLAAQHDEEDMVYDYCVNMVDYYRANMLGKLNQQDGLLEESLERFRVGNEEVFTDLESILGVVSICLEYVR